MRGGFNDRTVTYDLSGGAGMSPTTVSTFESATISLAGTPTKVGYQFEGWQLGSTRYSASSAYTVTTSVTFTAVWSAKRVAYSYNLNGATGITPGDGSVLSEAGFITAPAPSRTGYNFLGWNTKADGSGTPFAAGTSVVMPASDNAVVFYAQWQARTVTFSYNLNGGNW